jgi:DNA-directed RNA polymerase III subunit RPC4
MLQLCFFNHPLILSYIPNAEILDEEEFGESSASRAQDSELTAAEELGLMVLYYRIITTLSFVISCHMPLEKTRLLAEI